MSNTKNPEQAVKHELEVYEKKQLALDELTKQLESNPEFKAFIKARNDFQKVEAAVWKNIEEVMIANDVKSIKTDKMTLTIAERTSFDIDLDLLPNKYIKRVPNTTLIGSEYKLTNKPVKGTTPKVSHYLTKRFKSEA